VSNRKNTRWLHDGEAIRVAFTRALNLRPRDQNKKHGDDEQEKLVHS
jgi:hypothetical protein